MKHFIRWLFGLSILFTSTVPTHAKTLVEEARDTGVLSAETALLYQLYEIVAPQQLPATYRQDHDHAICGTPIILAALAARQEMSEADRQGLAKTLARPNLNESYRTASGRFRIHYDLQGRNGINPIDANNNGLPDYIDDTENTLETIWRLQIETLGYLPPPSDGGLGGGEEFDVYITQLGNRVYGYTFPDGGGPTTASYLEIDNDYTDPLYVQTRELEALQVTLAHEFFHSIQFGYYQGSDSAWWQEATATWMEEVAFPEVDDYLQYVSSLLDQTERSIDSGSRFNTSDLHIYGISLFAHFLDQRFERALIRLTWEEIGRTFNAELANFDGPIRNFVPGGLAAVIGEYAVWNFFTGRRSIPGRFYQESEKYPQVSSQALQPVDGSAVLDNGQVDHLGSTYYVLDPRRRPGGAVLNFELKRGRWDTQLILISRDSVEVRPVEQSPVQVADWDSYDEIALVLTSTEQRGFGFEYSISASYESDLSGGAVPVAFELGQNYPNPFLADGQANTSVSFALTHSSDATQVSVFGLDGRLIHHEDLGPRAARRYLWEWDGRNQEGELVASGLYYYILETSAERAVKTLALIRE
jgi:hypothetical protein